MAAPCRIFSLIRHKTRDIKNQMGFDVFGIPNGTRPRSRIYIGTIKGQRWVGIVSIHTRACVSPSWIMYRTGVDRRNRLLIFFFESNIKTRLVFFEIFVSRRRFSFCVCKWIFIYCLVTYGFYMKWCVILASGIRLF